MIFMESSGSLIKLSIPFLALVARVSNFIIELKIPDITLFAIVLFFFIWLLVIAKRVEKRVNTGFKDIRRLVKGFETEKIHEELRPKRIEEEPKAEPVVEEKFEEKEKVWRLDSFEVEEPERKLFRKKREEEVIELNKEELFLLSAIADEPEKMYQKEKLFNLYKMTFSEKDKPQFESAIKKLEKYKLIKSDSSSDYTTWIELTDKGLEYMNRKRGY